MSESRQLHLAGFFSAGNVTHAHGAWRHARATNGFLTKEYYQHIARTLERGKFDLLFLPDGLAVEDGYGDNLETGVRYGGQGAVALEPAAVIATMAAVTERLQGWARPFPPPTTRRITWRGCLRRWISSPADGFPGMW